MASGSKTKKQHIKARRRLVKSVPPVPPDARAISVPQAARVTGLCERTLYDRIATGQLKALRTGNRTLITLVDLDRFLGIRN
jgi:excisionase family DNA binding protein